MSTFLMILAITAGATPPPAQMPKVILVGAIDSLDISWRDRGFDGVALRNPGAPANTGSVGHTTLAPSLQWFTMRGDNDWFDSAEEIETAAIAAAASGLDGILIDTNSGAPCYWPAWDGYSPGVDPVTLSDRALRFGRTAGRAALESGSVAGLYVLADSVLAAGPLWFDLLEGLLDAARESPASRVYLLSGDSLEALDLTNAEGLAEEVRSFINAVLPASARQVWRQQGSLGFGVPWSSAADASPDSFQTRLIAAKLYSDHFIWLDARGRTIGSGAEFAGPTVLSPIDKLTRVGPLESAAGYILRDEDGAVRVSSEDTSGGNVPLIERKLPIARFGMTPSMSCAFGSVQGDDAPLLPVSFGWVNRTGFIFRGRIEAVAPIDLAVTPNSREIELRPGEGVEVTAVVTGAIETGAEVSLRLVLTAPGVQPAARTFTTSVSPRLVWERRVYGVSAVPPIVTASETGSPELLVLDSTGAINAIDAIGSIRNWTGSPIADGRAWTTYRHWSGTTWHVLTGSDGAMALLDELGNTRPLPAGIVQVFAGPMVGRLHPFPGDEYVTADEAGRITATVSNGQMLWRYVIGEPVSSITRVVSSREVRDSVIVVSGAPPNRLTCLDSMGSSQWSVTLNSPIACGAFEAVDGVAVFGLESGEAVWMDVETGAISNRVDVFDQPIRFLTVVEAALLACSSSGIAYVALNQGVVWRSDVPAIAAPTRWRDRRGGTNLLIPTQSDGLHCYSMEGVLLWADKHAASPLASSPVVLDLDGDGTDEMIYTAHDFAIRCVKLP